MAGWGIIYGWIAPICPLQVDTISLQTQNSPDNTPKSLHQHRCIRNAVFLPQFRTIIHHSLIWSMGYFLRRNPMWTVKKLRPIHSGKDARNRLERWGARWRDAWNEREIGQSLSRHKRGRKSGGGERVPHVERRGEMVTWSHWTISLLQLMNPYQDHEIKMERRSARSLQSLGVN